MPSVTVTGANNSTVTLTYNSSDASSAAQAVASAISTNVQNGALTPVSYNGGALPTESNAALFVDDSAVPPGPLSQQAGYNTIVDSASSPVTFIGNQAAVQQIITGDGGLNYYFGNASFGTIVAGDGNNYVTDIDPSTGVAQPSGGIRQVSVGNGNNTIALETGQNDITTGTGTNTVALGSSTSSVHTNAAGGQTTVFGSVNLSVSASSGSGPASSGSDTVYAGAGATFVYGGFSDFNFVGGTGTATVQGVGGSDTVFANGTTGLFVAGTAGDNLILGGNTSATQVTAATDPAGGYDVTSGQVLVGVANGDQLIAATNGAEWLQAGAGNETLNGANSTANNTYYTGQNATVNGDTFYALTQVSTGSGNSTVMGSTGASTVTAGPGGTTYEFVQGQAAGGTMTITDFNPSKDAVRLYGYAGNAAQSAIAGAQVTPSGTIVTLSDNTKITFLNYTGGLHGNSIA